MLFLVKCIGFKEENSQISLEPNLEPKDLGNHNFLFVARFERFGYQITKSGNPERWRRCSQIFLTRPVRFQKKLVNRDQIRSHRTMIAHSLDLVFSVYFQFELRFSSSFFPPEFSFSPPSFQKTPAIWSGVLAFWSGVE